MDRLLREAEALGVQIRTILITHTHNERVWSPSLGQALPPEGYRDLFETTPPRLFAEAGLLDDVVAASRARLSTPFDEDRPGNTSRAGSRAASASGVN